MSKKQEETNVQLPKSSKDYGYEGNEQITISASEFFRFSSAINDALAQGTKGSFDEVVVYVDPITSKVVDNPTEEQLRNREVVPVGDKEKTFNPGNLRISYESWVSPNIIHAKELLMKIHSRNIELGIAKPAEKLQAAKQGPSVENLDVQGVEVVEPQANKEA